MSILDLVFFLSMGNSQWDDHSDTGLSINGGYPKWLVFVRENPIYKWMITGGSPMTQEKKKNMFLSQIQFHILTLGQEMRESNDLLTAQSRDPDLLK